MELGFCQQIQQYDVTVMTSNYVIVPIKLCLVVGNDERFLLCDFGGRIMSGLKNVLGGAPEAPIRSQEAKGYSTGVIDPDLPANSECHPPPPPFEDKGLFIEKVLEFFSPPFSFQL